MTNQKLKFEDFNVEKLSKNQQKTVRGGDGETTTPPTVPPVPCGTDPGKGGNTAAS